MRRRSHAALLEMLDRAAQAGSFEAPWRATPQVWEFFRDEGEILRHLQRQWRTALAGAVYVAIEQGDGNLQQDVLTAFDKVKGKHYALRQVLEAHAHHPAIASAMRKERSLLSAFTALSSGDGAPMVA